MSTSHGSTEPGETRNAYGSNDVEAACCPERARPIGVDKVPRDSAAAGEVWFEDFTLANSASSSRMRCWLAVSATGCVGSQDCINWATSFAMY